MNYKRIKRLLYSFAFLDDFVLIYPLYALLFAHHGLGAAAISSLYIAWSVTGFVFEVPAGSIADKYPRRSVLLAAVAVKALGFSCWLVYPHYLGFLLGFVLWGVSGSLISGTEEALVYDELQRAYKGAEYTKVTGRMGGLRMFGVVVASFAASPLAHLGYPVILILSVVMILSSAIPIWLLPRVAPVEAATETHYLAHIRQGFGLIFKNRQLLLVVVYGAIATGLMADEYYSLFLQERGFSVSGVALLLGAISLFGTLGNLMAHRLQKLRLPLATLLVFSAICLYLSASLPRALTAVFLSLIDIYTFAIAVLSNSRIQEGLSDSHRATATSVYALVVELFALLTFGIFAVASQLRSYTFGMQVLAIVIALLAFVYAVLSRRTPAE